MTENGAFDDEASSEPAPRRSARPRTRRRLASLNTERPELLEALRRARLALPGDPRFGDPLSTAGPGRARAVARAADRIVGGTPSVVREVSFGALQVWQHMLERVGRGQGTQSVTVMFTDLVAFSRWSLGVGDETTLELLRRVAAAIEPPVAAHGGQVVKRMGDGMMAVFYTPDRAVQAAVAAAAALDDVELDGYRPQMRVGMHTGTPRPMGGDWFGVDVNIAARVMECGGNGRTMLSGATLDALHPDTLPSLGARAKPYRRNFFAPLSGVPDDLRIYTLTHPR